MPDLLLELLSEEIPARMQGRAAEDLKKLVTDALVAQGLLYEGAVAQATPRRLVLHVAGLPAKGKDVREEKRGPRVGAPEAALAGFRKSAGVTSDDQVRIVKDEKKGDFYLATIERPGRPTPQVLSELLPGIIKTFPWPKSMRWGAASREPGSLRWVRPLQSVLCTFGSDLETAEIVPLLIDGLISGDATRGHRFMAPGVIRARRWDDYVARLHDAKVVVDAGRRRDTIRHEARELAFAQGLEVVEDEALLEEVAGLVEWPVCLMGSFEEAFLDMPPEVIRATIRANQKCFVLRKGAVHPPSPGGGGSSAEPAGRGDTSLAIRAAPEGAQAGRHPTPDLRSDPPPPGEGGRLVNRFILVSNIEASDGGKAIVAGNERVVRARLADAKFFWDADRKRKLDDRLERLTSIVFHEKLGTQAERVERIVALARELALIVGADVAQAERAARLAKADLVTGMVGEFPELQGLMGRYYAAAQGETPAVAAAVEDHYRPLGPTDRVPTDPVTVAVALADKLDTLVGFWAIDEKPTGSKDPYALRRAALGVIRLVLENGLRVPLRRLIIETLLTGIIFAGDVYGDVFMQDRTDFVEDEIRFLTSVKPVGAVGYFLRSDGAYHEYVSHYKGLIDRRKGYLPEEQHDQLERRMMRRLRVLFGYYAQGEISRDGERIKHWSEKEQEQAERELRVEAAPLAADLLSFFHDRLKVYLRDRGARHDLIDAVLSANTSQPRHAEERPEAASRSTQDGGASVETPASPAPQDDEVGGAEAGATSPSPGGGGSTGRPAGWGEPAPHKLDAEGARPGHHPTPDLRSDPPPPGEGGGTNDDLLIVVRRVDALSRFLATEDGKNLLAATKRAANILRIEEKKDARSYDEIPDLAALVEPQEKALAIALARAAGTATEAIGREAFEDAMAALAELRPAVDAFFEKVTVNAPDAKLRENRLRLLAMLRRATLEVADFSKIEG